VLYFLSVKDGRNRNAKIIVSFYCIGFLQLKKLREGRNMLLEEVDEPGKESAVKYFL
jgi:hypothetical protein